MGTTIAGRNGIFRPPLLGYPAVVRGLSDRLVEAQRPVRILDAIKWDDSIERAFFAAECRELPTVTAAYYCSRRLPFDPENKLEELNGIERDIQCQLGESNAPGQIMLRMCREYIDVVRMLIGRGTQDFGAISRSLYGSAFDRCQVGDPPLADLGQAMLTRLVPPACALADINAQPLYTAWEAVGMLSARLKEYFCEPVAVRVKLSDGIVADAAAGCDYIKLRTDATFTGHDLRVLEVHEGWVHLGTTVNGQSQPICTFLGKGPPSATMTQEGLAVLTEILASASHPGRVRRLINRIRGVALAESGANFLEVYRHFMDEGCEQRESYQHAMRIFRGSLPEGNGPFSKDLCYIKGFVLVCNFIRQAVRNGNANQVPLLFCGKTTLQDMPMLAQLVDEGLVAPPRFVPPHFTNLQTLSVCTT